MKDGIYFEIFVVKDGVRYNAKIIDAKEVSGIMANSVMDGLGKVMGFEDSNHPTEKDGKRNERFNDNAGVHRTNK